MKRYLPHLVAALAVVLVVGVLLVRSGQRRAGRDALPIQAASANNKRAMLVRYAEERRRELVDALRLPPESAVDLARRPLPRSLRDTDVDGGLAVDEDGHLILGRGVRDLFDYFLSASGEEPLRVIRARIIAEILKRLPPGTARDEALQLLDRYLEYRERARDLYASGKVSSDLGARMEQIRALRREVLGDDVSDAFFGEEEAHDYVALAEHEVAGDSSLTKEEKRQKIEELEQQLPDDVRRAREETMKPVRYFRDEAQLRQEGASPEEIRALREDYFGPEAADRLEVLDQKQSAWQERMDTYRAARREIEADTSRTVAEKKAAIEDLRAQHFDERERIRAAALDRIEKLGGNATAGKSTRSE